MKRYIHLDMDAFFASVEQLDHPELRGRPIAVGGSARDGGRGVVATASYEARKFGVRSAMAARKALELCPELHFVKPHFARYSEVSQHMRSIAESFSVSVFMRSIDECLLDVSELPPGYVSAAEVALDLKAQVARELGLSVSLGVAPLRFLAKVASDDNKPNGLTVITPHQVLPYLQKLPLSRIPGVGPKTSQRYQKRGVFTGGDLLKKGEEWVQHHFGTFGVALLRKCQGWESEVSSEERVRKQVGAERTLLDEPLTTPKEVHALLKQLACRVAKTLRKKSWVATTVSIKVRTTHFQTKSRSLTLATSFNDDETVTDLAWQLFSSLVERHPEFSFAHLKSLPSRSVGPSAEKRGGLRLLGVSLSGLQPCGEGEAAGVGSPLLFGSLAPDLIPLQSGADAFIK